MGTHNAPLTGHLRVVRSLTGRLDTSAYRTRASRAASHHHRRSSRSTLSCRLIAEPRPRKRPPRLRLSALAALQRVRPNPALAGSRRGMGRVSGYSRV